MQQISFILSILGLISMIIASLIKGEKIKKTLIFVFAGNILVGTSYLFGQLGLNGAISCYIGGSQAIINYFFSKKNKPIPTWLMCIYAALFFGANVAVLTAPVGILALLASLSFVGCVSAKNGASYRIWQTVNSTLWILYDIFSKSYAPLVTHVTLCTFTLVGVLINDFKNKK